MVSTRLKIHAFFWTRNNGGAVLPVGETRRSADFYVSADLTRPSERRLQAGKNCVFRHLSLRFPLHFWPFLVMRPLSAHTITTRMDTRPERTRPRHAAGRTVVACRKTRYLQCNGSVLAAALALCRVAARSGLTRRPTAHSRCRGLASGAMPLPHAQVCRCILPARPISCQIRSRFERGCQKSRAQARRRRLKKNPFSAPQAMKFLRAIPYETPCA